MTVKLSNDIINIISVFESVTGVHARDCILTENCIYFLVNNDKVGLAVGKSGQNVKKLNRSLRKNIKILGYLDTAEDFIKSNMPNIKKIETNNGHLIAKVDRKDKVVIIGKGGENIKAIRKLLERNFHITDFRVR
ncbi:MAG: NusA-like transcription termination signal-binding factor [Candidatus Aenigmarchaeota archaeon]|nr:NusA-like transcription termination signal-binding factor [Candidatus Aenigmarchaeota archaeon]